VEIVLRQVTKVGDRASWVVSAQRDGQRGASRFWRFDRNGRSCCNCWSTLRSTIFKDVLNDPKYGLRMMLFTNRVTATEDVRVTWR